MEIPSIVGFTLGEARVLLDRAKVMIQDINVTAPPKYRTDQFDEHYRVVRVDETDDRKVLLVVCRQI